MAEITRRRASTLRIVSTVLGKCLTVALSLAFIGGLAYLIGAHP